MNITVLLEFFKKMYDEHWSYIWGSAKDGYTDEKGNYHPGIVDCSGAFVRAYLNLLKKKIAHGSNTLFRDRKFCGEPTKMPKPGYVAFKMRDWAASQANNTWYGSAPGDMYHIGLVDETGDYVYNAKGTKYGFCKDPIKGWAYFAPLKDFIYEEGISMPTNEEMAVPFVGTVHIDSGYLRLRAEPNVKCSVLAKLESGTMVKVTEDLGTWYKVATVDGMTGYVYTKYVKPTGETLIDPSDIVAVDEIETTTFTDGKNTFTVLGHWWAKKEAD